MQIKQKIRINNDANHMTNFGIFDQSMISRSGSCIWTNFEDREVVVTLVYEANTLDQAMAYFHDFKTKSSEARFVGRLKEFIKREKEGRFVVPKWPRHKFPDS